jgi:DNA-binding transcriptional MerR regulator
MASAAHRQESAAIPHKELFRIGEVSRLTATKPYVLRFWEDNFPSLQPVKAPSGHRLYRRADIEMVFEIKRLLQDEGFTIAGARKHLEDLQVAGAHSNGSLPASSHDSSGDPAYGSARAPGNSPIGDRPGASQLPLRAETPLRMKQKFLLDLLEELQAVLTLLERE